jgi:hypothetical protein
LKKVVDGLMPGPVYPNAPAPLRGRHNVRRVEIGSQSAFDNAASTACPSCVSMSRPTASRPTRPLYAGAPWVVHPFNEAAYSTLVANRVPFAFVQAALPLAITAGFVWCCITVSVYLQYGFADGSCHSADDNRYLRAHRVGSTNHLAGELFKSLVGIPDVTPVPYRGAGPLLSDLISGHVPIGVVAVTGQSVGFHRVGNIRILTVTSPQALIVARPERSGSALVSYAGELRRKNTVRPRKSALRAPAVPQSRTIVCARIAGESDAGGA